MGEIADMMLDGTLCEGCGMDMPFGEAAGFPRYCSKQCAKDRLADFTVDDRHAPNVPRANRYGVKPSPNKAGHVSCPVCQKILKKAGLGDHVRDMHPETQRGEPDARALSAEAARCKAAGILNHVNGTCTTCDQPVDACPCIPF